MGICWAEAWQEREAGFFPEEASGFAVGFRCFGEFVDFFQEVHDIHAADGGGVVAEVKDGSGFEDDPLHHLRLDRAVVAVEFFDDG